MSVCFDGVLSPLLLYHRCWLVLNDVLPRYYFVSAMFYHSYYFVTDVCLFYVVLFLNAV